MIFPLLCPCINYRAIKYAPVSIEFGKESLTVPQTLLIQGDNLSPCILYRGISDTGASYCTNCALCNADHLKIALFSATSPPFYGGHRIKNQRLWKAHPRMYPILLISPFPTVNPCDELSQFHDDSLTSVLSEDSEMMQDTILSETIL